MLSQTPLLTSSTLEELTMQPASAYSTSLTVKHWLQISSTFIVFFNTWYVRSENMMILLTEQGSPSHFWCLPGVLRSGAAALLLELGHFLDINSLCLHCSVHRDHHRPTL